MPILRPLAFVMLLVAQFPPPALDVPKHAGPEWLAPYRDATGRLTGEAVSSDAAWQRLAYLGDTYGHRLSGSPNLEAAIRWAVEEMKRDGLENVHTEPVKVPHWVRGRESLEIAGAIPQPLVMLGLGNSVGTPAAGIEAELVVVHSFEELEAARDRVRGRIVLFNVPRRLASEIGKTGLSAVDGLGADRRLVARDLQCPASGTYYDRFVEAMGGHSGTTTNFYFAQCVKDETMGEAVADLFQKTPGRVSIVHFDGAFHSDFGQGSAESARRRMPGRRIAVVSIVPVTDIDAAKPGDGDLKRADYLLYTVGKKP